MITINGQKINIEHFPDGTQRINNLWAGDFAGGEKIEIKWTYENEEELISLIYIVNHLRETIPLKVKNIPFILYMPYLPNARMDRTKSFSETFTLKYFCWIINSLKFDAVKIFDPHSNVGPALIDNVFVVSPEEYIQYAINDIEGVDIDGGKEYGGKTVIYFPDEGAMKRYKDMSCFKNHEIIYGMKEREWSTGQIKGIKILDQDGHDLGDYLAHSRIEGKVVLMVDDIISYGGTLAYSADSLKKLGASAIYAYASHTENSVLDEERGTLLKRLNDGTVDEIFTTNSLYTGEHPKIKVFVV